jgi:hypothetical protein
VTADKQEVSDHDLCGNPQCGHPNGVHDEHTGACCYATCHCRAFVPKKKE